jgi:osmotically-inducible protein OsmY
MTIHASLYKDVIDKLNFEPFLDTQHITVGITEEGVITLKGKVASYMHKKNAEEAVKKVRGVKGIANDLEVELAGTHRRDDTDIAQAAVNSLKWNFIPEDRVKVIVEDGWLTLTGEVDYYSEKQEAEIAVQRLLGVRGVTNLITLKPHITPQEVKSKILSEFQRIASLNAKQVQVEIYNDTIILKGTVSSWHEIEEAETAAWKIPGVREVDNKLTIE